MGRCAYKDGISAMVLRHENRRALRVGESEQRHLLGSRKTHKKITPPREKNALVDSGMFKNTVPIMIPWKM